MLMANLARMLRAQSYYAAGYLRASVLGVQVGRGARISPRARIRGAASIGAVTVGAGVSIGPGTYVGSGLIDSGVIGAYCSIGHDVYIGPTEHEMSGWTMSPFLLRALGEDGQQTEKIVAPPRIGCDVWIGARAIILRGAVIGDGAVIAAGSVVKGRIDPYEVWGGVPARAIRARFAEESARIRAQQKLDDALSRLVDDQDEWRVG